MGPRLQHTYRRDYEVYLRLRGKGLHRDNENSMKLGRATADGDP